MRSKTSLFFAVMAAGISLSAAPAVMDNPYGVCAHVSREGELPIAAQEFARMHEADINWVRTDFDWNRVEVKQGEWTFAHLDKLMAQAKKDNINILPILDYSVPWAHPSWKHLDKWSEYIQKMVSRYSKDIRIWEVWNEQNIHFWGDTPSGTNYAVLLKRSYEEIKKIDPELTVLYGGTAGVPLAYIEDSFKAGAGAHFDVMNIHPYNWQETPESMIAQIDGLQSLMAEYKVDKPIWITEVGWSTAKPPELYADVLPAAFQRAGIDASKVTAAIVSDIEMGFQSGMHFDPSVSYPMFKKIETVTLAQLKDLSVERYPVLIPAANETFPGVHIPDLVNYVKRGGTLLLPSGLPFYYDYQLSGKEAGTKIQVNDKFLPQLHIGWDAWWTQEGVPKKETYQKPAPGFENAFKVRFKPSERFLHSRNLKPGDEYIPIVEAGTKDFKGSVVGLYKLNSDLKGNIIVCTSLAVSESVPEERQAEMLPRTYLIAFAKGIDRVFWYNFRSGEWEPDEREAHFGIVRKNLTPKPGFVAYQTLTKLCPTGSTVPEMKMTNSVYTANWTRPDGKKVWAIWAIAPKEATIQIQGNVTDAQNHLGAKQAVPSGKFTAGPAMLYLVGPESVTVN